MSFIQSGDDGPSFFDQATAALIKPARQFGSIVAQITISERHTDRAEKTSHPVEATANISDHIIPQPMQIMVRMGWTNYGLQSPSSYVNEAITSTPVPIPQSITAIYAAMRGILYGRVPIKIVTGKRTLPNMILLSITEETDERTENSLILSCLCEEIFLVQTQLIQMPPNSVQANPMDSASPTNYGTKQPVLANSPLNSSDASGAATPGNEATIGGIAQSMGYSGYDPNNLPTSDLTPGTPDYVAAVQNGSISLPPINQEEAFSQLSSVK